MFAQGRHTNKCYDFFGDIIHGAKGSAILGEGQPKPRLYKGYKQTPENMIWEFKGVAENAYQREHDLFFDAILNDKAYNEAERCAKSCLAAVMGRMACESGDVVSVSDALASNLELAPALERMTSLDSPAPVKPDSAGAYPIAMPGRTKAL